MSFSLQVAISIEPLITDIILLCIITIIINNAGSNMADSNMIIPGGNGDAVLLLLSLSLLTLIRHQEFYINCFLMFSVAVRILVRFFFNNSFI